MKRELPKTEKYGRALHKKTNQEKPKDSEKRSKKGNIHLMTEGEKGGGDD